VAVVNSTTDTLKKNLG